MNRKKGYIRKVIELLTAGEKRRLVVVLLGSIFTTLVEVLGIGSVMPFVAVATKPSMIRDNHYLAKLYDLLGFPSETSFIIFLGIAVMVLLVLTNASQAFLHYIKVRFTSMRRHSLSLRLLTGYLRQTFIFFLNKNSFDFVKNINTEIGNMINTTLMQLVEFLSRIIQVSLLTLFLVLVNPTSTLLVVLAVIGLYGLVYIFVRKNLKRLGAERFELNRERARIVSEAFWGIKEMKITGCEQEMISEYTPPSRRLAHNETISVIISDAPKFALETVAFSTIIGYVLLKIIQSGGFGGAAGSITLFVYAGYRLIPAIQALFRSIAQLRYGAATADKITREFEIVSGGPSLSKARPPRLRFSRILEVRNMSFTFPNVDNPTIHDLSLGIAANSMIGLAGKTGSGKTTLVDIIMCLLVPQTGSLSVDGVPLQDGTIRSWQMNIGYVPQNIYLSNDSISGNIAFGVAKKKINMEAVVRAAKLAQLHDFIEAELKDGYDTKIGERGIRLSGGQRQRIGIARALYREPSVLIMDEATSSLDSQTERAVMEAIDALQGTRTIILIAHRLTTLKQCDVIHLMEKGRIVDSGKYQELLHKNRFFSG
jgi:ABC-type multidrug transport system fused ATPase/permease subunit